MAVCQEEILSEEYRDFIIASNVGRVNFPVDLNNVCKQSVGVGYEVIYVEQSLIGTISFGKYTYNSVPQCYGLLDINALNEAGISQIQYYPGLELMGEGILIGFIDTGIDYTNPIFRNLDGSSRILGIWDQTVQTGTPPENLNYGTEYTKEMIDEALRTDTPYEVVESRDTDGHGTFMASIACGSGNVENQFMGAAPESAIGVVKLKPAKTYLREYYEIPQAAVCYQENDVMLAMKYLLDLAQRNNLPLVICLALGTNFGGHSGTSPLASLLEVYANTINQIVVTGTGNEANERHHYSAAVPELGEINQVEIQVANGVDGFALELWTELPNIMGVTITSPSGESIPIVSIRQGMAATYQFVFERTEVFVDNQILVERNSAQLIFFRFRRPAAGIWKIGVESIRNANGTFNMWLPINEFLTNTVVFLEANPETTLTCPSSAIYPISVGYYNGAENSIDIRSGRGYTRTDRIKPDLAAPGVGVLGADLRGNFVTRTGSSIAIAVAAGASALLLQWLLQQDTRRGYDTVQLKGLFILGAGQRGDLNYPNPSWGYGTLNLYNTLQAIREL